MTDQASLIRKLDHFLGEFSQLNSSYKENVNNYDEMEKKIGEFTAFILIEKNEAIWEQIELQNDANLEKRVEELRNQSAFCVWAMEKYRAIEFQKNRQGIADYFNNIEASIATEFGSFEITANSKVLMIGSGAFPMTPLLIANKTGAKVVGIDIDLEAIDLSRNVVSLLDKSSNITIEACSIDQLDFTKEATHIIFSSTIKEKFELLTQLHALTNMDVVVAMRYGNGLKSLFNYPLQDVDSSLWNIVKSIAQPENIFDVVLYKKGIDM